MASITPMLQKTRTTSSLSRWLDLFQAILVVVFLVPCFLGKGHAKNWILCMGILPAIRLFWEPSFRHRVYNLFSRCMHQIRDYSNGGAIPWRATAFLVLIPTAVLNLHIRTFLGTGDTWPVMPTAASLVTEGNWNLDESARLAPQVYLRETPPHLPCCTVLIHGHVYSAYPSGMVQFALPIAVVSRLLGADLHKEKTFHRLEWWTSAWVGGLCIAAFFLVALRLSPITTAWIATFILMTGSALYTSVGTCLGQHGGVAFWSMVLILVELTVKRHTWKTVALQSVACAMMFACRSSSGVIILSFGLWLFVQSPRRAIAVGFGSMLAFLPWALLHYSIYGSPLGVAGLQMGDRMWNLNNLREGLPGLLVSPSRGLFIYQPWAILMFGTFLLSLRSRSESVHAIHWLCLPVIVLHVLLVGCWCCWWGGDSWGSRLLTEIIPWIGLLCLPAITCLRQHFSGMLLLTVLVGISVWMQTQGAFFNQHWNRRMQIENHPEMLWSWKQAPWIRIQQ